MKKRLNVDIELELYNTFKELADKLDMPISRLVRRLIKQTIEEDGRNVK